MNPENILDDNLLLNVDMLANKERDKLKCKKAIPILKRLGDEPK